MKLIYLYEDLEIFFKDTYGYLPNDKPELTIEEIMEMCKPFKPVEEGTNKISIIYIDYLERD